MDSDEITLAMRPDVVCSKCGCTYPAEIADVFFRALRTPSRIREVKLTCIGCEQTARDERKRENRTVQKANDTIKSHARRFGLDKAQFCRRFGWDSKRIAHDIEHAYENTCGYCYRPYREMEHGLADVTIDIIDPQRDPYYDTNTQPCCRTCNTAKGPLSPEQWALKRMGWRLWSDQHDAGVRPVCEQQTFWIGFS